MVILQLMRLNFFILFFLIVNSVVAQPGIQDLKNRWLINNDGKLIGFSQEEEEIQSITFIINTTEATGSKLKIGYILPISLFVNNTLLLTNREEISLSVDSLREYLNTTQLQVSVFHAHLNPTKLTTTLVKDSFIEDVKLTKKVEPIIPLDFVIISALTISLLLLTIILLNPKLATDYFSVSKLFSFREREEGQVYNRITGSTNFLFFGFSALTMALVLTLSKPIVDFGSINQENLTSYFTYWLGYTALLLLIVALRMINTYFQAWLFNAREVAGLQFFNWIRAMFLLSGFCLFVIVFCHITSITNLVWLKALFQIVMVGTLVWNAIATFKVANKVQLGLFHLFSYLCVTEIVPSLVIFKLLY